MLSNDVFKLVIENTPLFSIDLVVVDQAARVLVGQRLNPPAQNYWFVPGGRVFKNESLADAFVRISQAELGLSCTLDQGQLMGMFEHFYPDSVFNDSVSTHYINAPYLIRLESSLLSLPFDQHEQYRWLSLDELERDKSVHKYSKVFLAELRTALSG